MHNSPINKKLFIKYDMIKTIYIYIYFKSDK